MSANGEWRNNIRAQGDHIMALIREECDGWVRDVFPYIEESIPKIFSAFQCGDPDRAQTMIDELTEAKFVMEKDIRLHLGGAQLDMDGWTGAAADDFRDFLLNLEDAMELLLSVIEALLLILRAYQALVLAMRDDAVRLVDQTLKAYEEAGADGWKIALAVVGAIAGVAAAAVSGGTSLAVVGAISGSLVTGGTSVANEVIDADSELSALLSINKNGLSVISKIDIERAKLEKALRELAEFVSGAKLAEVRPARPVVITAPSFDPGSFGMTDEAQGKHRKPTDKTDLVPEPKRDEDGPYDKPIFSPDETDRYEEQGPA